MNATSPAKGSTLVTRFGSFALEGLKLFGIAVLALMINLGSRYRIDQDWHINSRPMAWVVFVDVCFALGGLPAVQGRTAIRQILACPRDASCSPYRCLHPFTLGIPTMARGVVHVHLSNRSPTANRYGAKFCAHACSEAPPLGEEGAA
jgi:hypothetical protein